MSIFIEESEGPRRKAFLGVSVGVNLGLLFFFKYCNFFISSFSDLMSGLGMQANLYSLQIILPVGISFYTFQTMSYTIDVYRREMKASRDIVSFLAYVSFFPQLVAGPIERAKNLLPQFFIHKTFSYGDGVNGLVFIFWGLFKKIVIADNCAVVVNSVFENFHDASGLQLILGAVLFAFQIYGDFSGYSDIAIGTALLFGYRLMVNFRVPYFSRSIGEFWRRWHISLSTWFRDYLYIPLGGSKGPKEVVIRNTFLVFIISGFWHGANWTFVIWGFLNALYFLPLLLTNSNRNHLDTAGNDRVLPAFKEILLILMTFSQVVLAWIVFRSKTVAEAWHFLRNIFENDFLVGNRLYIPDGVKLIPVLILIEWIFRREDFPFSYLKDSYKWVIIFLFMLVITAFRYIGKSVEFIYFQF